MTTLQLMEQDTKPTKSIFNEEFKLKDIVQFFTLLVAAIVFILTMNSKIEALTVSINELRDNDTKQSIANDLSIKALQNQVNTQTIQISLLQKDVELLKGKNK